MKYSQIQGLEEDKFCRLTGVTRSTFEKMISILTDADIKKKANGGRKNKLCIEEQLLMMLEYIREYRTLGLTINPKVEAKMYFGEEVYT